MLEPREGACITVTQAYSSFCTLSEQRSLEPLKRSIFRETMKDLVQDRFNLALRNDVPDAENRHQQAWKGLPAISALVASNKNEAPEAANDIQKNIGI